jgi:hypothetical protein
MEVHLSTRMGWSDAKRNVPTGHGRAFPGAIHTHGGLQRWELSADNGATWKTVFQGKYSRRNLKSETASQSCAMPGIVRRPVAALLRFEFGSVLRRIVQRNFASRQTANQHA